MRQNGTHTLFPWHTLHWLNFTICSPTIISFFFWFIVIICDLLHTLIKQEIWLTFRKFDHKSREKNEKSRWPRLSLKNWSFQVFIPFYVNNYCAMTYYLDSDNPQDPLDPQHNLTPFLLKWKPLFEMLFRPGSVILWYGFRTVMHTYTGSRPINDSIFVECNYTFCNLWFRF